MLQWYYSREGYKYGPVSRETLRRLAGRGTLGLDDLVWAKGLPDWRPARAIPGLFTANTNGLADVIPDGLNTKQTESSTLSEGIVQSQPVRDQDSVFANFLSWLHQGTSKCGKTVSWLFETMYDQAKMLKDQNVISELKSTCASLWSTSLNFWIRFSAWFLAVTVSSDRDPEKSSTTIKLSLCLFFLLALSMSLQGVYNVYTSYELSPLIGEWKLETNEHSAMTITKSVFSKNAVGGGKEFHADGFVTQPNIAKAFRLMEAISNKYNSTDLSNPVYNDKIWGQWALKEGKLYIVESVNWYEPSDVKRWGLGDFNNIYVKTKE